MTEGDATAGQIVWGKLNDNAITGQHANVVLAHAATEVTKHLMSVLQFDGELGVWQSFLDDAVNGDRIRIGATWSGGIGGSSGWLN